MPRSTPDGVWMEITRTPRPEDAAIVCPHASRDSALNAANDTGNRAIKIRFGESLADALARTESERTPPATKRSSGVGRAEAPERVEAGP